MNFFKQSFYYVILTTIILVALIYRFAMKNGKPHCDNFIVNVYLYITLSICLIGLFMHAFNILLNNSKNRYKLLPLKNAFFANSRSSLTILFYIIFLIVSFGSLIMLTLQNVFSKEGFLLNHILWVVFLSTLSLLMYPFFKSFQYSNLIGYAVYMTSIVFGLMSIIVYLFPTFFKETYKTAMMALLIGLISIIIFEIILIFTNSYNPLNRKIMFYFILIVFAFLVSYDTSRMFQYAKICVNSPNYPKISTSQTLNIVNLFQNFLVRR